MLNPIIRKTNFQWLTTSKFISILSGSILTLSLFSLFTPSELNRTQRLVIGAVIGLSSSSLLLGQTGSVLEKKQKANIQLQGRLKQKEETYQALTSSFTEEKKQLHQHQAQLEKQLKDTKQEIAKFQTIIEQQKQAYQLLQQNYQEMEEVLIEENQKLLQHQKDSEKDFQTQETGYLQEIEELELTNRQLEQKQVQLEEEINQLQQQLANYQGSFNQDISTTCPFNHLKIALIGAPTNVANQVEKTLNEEYGVKECKVISNMKNRHLSLKELKVKINDADLIFSVSSNNNNYNLLTNLKQSSSLKGEVVSLTNAQGSSQIIRQIVNQLELYSTTNSN